MTRNRVIEFFSGETTNISLSIGKRYMYLIADSLVNEETVLKRRYKAIDNFIGSIESKEVLNMFVLHANIKKFFNDENLFHALMKKLTEYELLDEDGYYLCLLSQIKNIFADIEKDKEKGNIHLFLKLQPKQPDCFNPIGDKKPVYKSILSKHSLKNYRKCNNQNKSSAEGWTYQLCVLYLVVINGLYHILQPHITDVETFLVKCFTTLPPVIVGARFKTQYKLNKIPALSYLYELFQLTSKDKRLQIHKRPDIPSIEFIYVSKESSFSHTEMPEEKTKFYGGRMVRLLITSKGNSINYRIDIVGQGALEDITGMACKKAFFSLITDDTVLEVITNLVLNRMLSYTNQHASVLNIANEVAHILYKQQKTNYVFENTAKAREAVKTLCKKKFIHNNIFCDLKQETILPIAEALISEFNLQKYQIDYVIIAVELAKYDNETASKEIADIGSKQQALIRRMIEFVRNYQTDNNIHVLNELYNIVTCWS